MFKKIVLFSLLSTFTAICLINTASASYRHERDLDYPYNVMGRIFDGCIVRADGGIQFSKASSNFNSKRLTVYSRPYAIAEKLGGGEAPLFEADDEYKRLCSDNIKAYFNKIGEEMSQEPESRYEEYDYYSLNDNVYVSSAGSRMSVRERNASHDYVMSVYEGGDLTDDKYIKAALEMAGCEEFSYTRTDDITSSDYGVNYYVYPSGAEAPQPYRVSIELSARKSDGDDAYIYISFQLNGYEGYKYGEYDAISYKEAFSRLKNNNYRSLDYDADLSRIAEDDVLCELVYTDAIDLHYMIPCYKFYVEVKDETWLKQESVSSDEKMYFYYYVPAVDMNVNPNTGEHTPAAVVLCAAALLGVAFVKRRKID